MQDPKELFKPGSIWSSAIPSRPDVEIVRYSEYSETVHWKYIDSSSVYESVKDVFIKNFKQK